MPMYWKLKRWDRETRLRTVGSLDRLRKSLGEIPARTQDKTLLLATWNIRDFDSNKFGHGPRLPESLYYIAEIINAFDIVAIQEVNDDIEPLEEVLDILGPSWTYIATDVTAGWGGNNERMAFVFDRRKVRFQNIAGEIVLPRNKLISEREQFARTPFAVSFQSGWFKFSLCAVHLYYGAASGEKLERRIEEIDTITKVLAERAQGYRENLILLGDFNIVSPEHKTMEALLRYGFIVPEELRHPTNLDHTKYYDQIAFMVKENELQMGASEPNAGTFDPYSSVFRESDAEVYAEACADVGKWSEAGTSKADREGYFKTWRSWQVSDHQPLWVELKIDFSEDYLAALGQ